MVIGYSIVQKRLPPQHDYLMDEFQCLNLNISCPKGSNLEDGLPVVVWVHGYTSCVLFGRITNTDKDYSGGNCVGTGSDPGYSEFYTLPIPNYQILTFARRCTPRQFFRRGRITHCIGDNQVRRNIHFTPAPLVG